MQLYIRGGSAEQVETLKVPAVVDELLEEYAQRYHAVKAPRKLQWRKNLGTVKVRIKFTIVHNQRWTISAHPDYIHVKVVRSRFSFRIAFVNH